MIAKDVMSTKLITVELQTTVGDIAKLLLKRRIGAVPVVDSQGKIAGIVSEGDLMRRPELETGKRPGSWWLDMFEAPEISAEKYAKSHGVHAADIMTNSVVTVSEDTPLAEIANILAEKHIKRVPVIRDGMPVGIVSRANLLQGLATKMMDESAPVTASDPVIRDHLLDDLREMGWVQLHHINVIVTDGVVHLWGMVDTVQEIKAITIAAERIEGVKAVESHLSQIMPWADTSE
jgi:CBS-domain-containing membrane protein